MAHGEQRKPVGRDAVAAPEREQHADDADRRAERGGDRRRQDRRQGTEREVGADRCGDQDRQLARGQAEREAVLKLDVGGKLGALAHPASTPALTTLAIT
jgi:hypothetical protein